MAAPESHSDRVIFKNGRTLDCSIEAVYPDSVEVSLGSGTMSIPRNQLARIERSEPSTQSPTKEARQKGNILSAQHAPEAYADLAADFRKLMESRNAALDANYMMNMYQQETHILETRVQNLNKEIDALGEKLMQIRKQMQEIKLPESPPRGGYAIVAYNELVWKKQKLFDQETSMLIEAEPLERKRMEAWEKIPELKARHKQAMTPIPLYRKDLDQFEAAYAEQRPEASTLESAPDAKALFDTIDRYLSRFKKEFSSEHVETRKTDNTTYVQVLVNGAFTGEFVLDTGASSMTITETFAHRLGLQLEALPNKEVTVADGSIVDVRAATLTSVSVGKSEIKDVDVVVFPDSPNVHRDGLLGMGFLKHFNISINGTTGELELTRFLP